MVWLVYALTTIVPELFGIREAESFRIADAHRGDGRRFVVHADERLPGVSGTGCGVTRSGAQNRWVIAIGGGVDESDGAPA